MIKIGINGFGRIGKSILNQSIVNNKIKVNAINFPGFNIHKIASYINHDSFHKTQPFNISVLDDNNIEINGNKIRLLDNRKPEIGMWEDAKYVFETTGKFLTNEKALEHGADYFIMCAPSKDKTPQYLYNGNHLHYKGERVISNSSCTTNCIVPLIKILNDKYGIEHCNFITVHAATASQKVLDGPHLKKRTYRSIFNNIIPHTTGASKSAIKILPELDGKIYGASVRVPTSNVSMVDMNVTLKQDLPLSNIFDLLRNRPEIVVNDDEHLVSTDFMTTTNPTIVDSAASMKMGPNNYKFTIWYDNEWSYSNQAIQLLEHIDTMGSILKKEEIRAEHYQRAEQFRESKKGLEQIDTNDTVLEEEEEIRTELYQRAEQFRESKKEV
ncbi:MAG: glyceraldehyde-3-phosphate dehydrogenase [Paracoccaceae bacterium]|nr:MAG: glyceraldehyde-3-phosphate dehydrogenase [Paracoccaceae bacterium]